MNKNRVLLTKLPSPLGEGFLTSFCRLFATDSTTVAQILQKTPMILLDNIPDALVLAVDQQLADMRNAGASIQIVNTLTGAVPKLSWPTPPPILKRAQRELNKHVLACPHCGGFFNLSPAAAPPGVIADMSTSPPGNPTGNPSKQPPLPRQAPHVHTPAPTADTDPDGFEHAETETPGESGQAPNLVAESFGLDEFHALSPVQHDAPMSLEDFEQSASQILHDAKRDRHTATPSPTDATIELPSLSHSSTNSALSGQELLEDLPEVASSDSLLEDDLFFELDVPAAQPSSNATHPAEAIEPALSPASSRGFQPGDYSVFLARVGSESKRMTASKLIQEIRGMDPAAVETLMQKSIIPIAKGIAQEDAEQIKKWFQEKGLNARITQKRK